MSHLVGKFHEENVHCEADEGEQHFHDAEKVGEDCLICKINNTDSADIASKKDCVYLCLQLDNRYRNYCSIFPIDIRTFPDLQDPPLV